MTAEPRDVDRTGWCEAAKHERCSGQLLTGTGYHWWCACTCHPEPQASDASPFAPPKAVERALATWRAARERLAPTDGAR